MSKHTPGPWHTGGKLDAIVYAPDGYAVAGCQTYHGLRDEACTAANARLIAAAPDLLVALNDLQLAVTMRPMGMGGLSTRERAVLDHAREVIKKARGE